MCKKLGLASLLLLVAVCGCSKVKAWFTNGDEEIQAALAAKATAKSFKMTTKIAAHDDNVMETQFYISCPDRERITLKISSQAREMIRVGRRFYLNEDGTWYYKDIDINDWSPCGRNAGLPSPWAMLTEGRDLLAVFASARDKFKVERADATEYNGKKYQTWIVGMAHGSASPFKYTVLLAADHRPVIIAIGKSSITEYSDWDKPMTIEAPANALPYPEEPSPAVRPSPSHAKGM